MLCLSQGLSSPLDFRRCPRKGRAAFAARDIAAGEELLVDHPLVSMALPETLAVLVACEQCCRPVGTMALQLRHLSKRRSLPAASEHLVEDELASNVPCRYSCAACFCSAECEEEAAAHRLLCPALAKSAIQRFEKHALRTYEVFLFGARIVASIHARAHQHARERRCCVARSGANAAPSLCKKCLDAAREPYDAFCRAPWWAISDEGALQARADGRVAKQAAEESLRLLLCATEAAEARGGVRARGGSGAGVRAWLDLEVWGGLLGAARRNAICVALSHPVDEWSSALRHVRRLASEEEEEEEEDEEVADPGVITENEYTSTEASAVIDALLEMLPSSIPAALSTALYPRIACLNHDCRPNAEVNWLGVTSEATLLARRAIACGEEITISYIDENERSGFRKRRASLRAYGFDCECSKCCTEESWTRRLRRRRCE
jgi:hypothetical protein